MTKEIRRDRYYALLMAVARSISDCAQQDISMDFSANDL